jgi:hypothetical protein
MSSDHSKPCCRAVVTTRTQHALNQGGPRFEGKHKETQIRPRDAEHILNKQRSITREQAGGKTGFEDDKCCVAAAIVTTIVSMLT